jgi:hypothetical protein
VLEPPAAGRLKKSALHTELGLVELSFEMLERR